MGIRVITIKDHHYGERRKVGESYEVPGQSVLTLVKAMGWAKEEEAAPAPASIRTAALTTARAVKPKAGGTYLTRDMKAEGPASPPGVNSPLRSFGTATPPAVSTPEE